MKWFLTQRLCGQPEIYEHDDDEDLELGFRLMRALAAESQGRMKQIAPGMWYVSKIPHDDDPQEPWED